MALVSGKKVADALAPFLNFGDRSRRMRFPLPNGAAVDLSFEGPIDQGSIDRLMKHLELCRDALPTCSHEILTKSAFREAFETIGQDSGAGEG